MLKKIGAISPPRTMPPRLLFGTKGMSSPMCQRRELQADFREDPVPTTSPTNATRRALLRGNFWIVSMPPGKRVSPIDRAWRGMSGLVEACLAGEKSSVLISPSTLKTTRSTLSGSPGRSRNHSAAAQDSRTLRRSRIVFRLGQDLVESTVDENDLFHRLGRGLAEVGIVQKADQGADIVAAEHGAEQLDGLLSGDEGGNGFPRSRSESANPP